MGEIQDPRIAEFCGAMIGDGWIQSDERCLFLAGDPVEDKDYYDYNISKIVTDIITPTKPKHFPYWKVYGISIYKKNIIKDILSNFKLPKGRKSKSARIPKWIVESEKEIREAFIRGLFDTDGGVFCQKDYTKYADDFNSRYHTKIRLRFTTISKELNNDIFNLLNSLEYGPVKRVIKKGFSNNRNNSDIHILEINRIDSIRRFFKEIKPSNPRHTTRYFIWKKFGFCPPNTTIIQRKDMLKNKINPYELYMQE